MYLDVNVNNIGENHTAKKDPTADIKQFYSNPFSMDGLGTSKKKRQHCNICKAGFIYYNIHILSCLIYFRKHKDYLLSGLGDDCSSLHRHLQAYHRVSHFHSTSPLLSNQSNRSNMRSGQSQRALSQCYLRIQQLGRLLS